MRERRRPDWVAVLWAALAVLVVICGMVGVAAIIAKDRDGYYDCPGRP